MITRIFIDNYRTFSNFEFRPGRLNLLIGDNGSGKSNLFRCLGGLSALIQRSMPIEEVFGTRDLTQWESRPTQRFEIDATIGERTYQYELELHHDVVRRTVRIQQEVVRCGPAVLFRNEDGVVSLHDNHGRKGTDFPWNGARSFLGLIESRPENSSLMELLAWNADVRQLKLSIDSIESVTRSEDSALAIDGSNFASWYRNLVQERPSVPAELARDLHDRVSGFQSLALVNAGDHGRTRDLIARLEANGSAYQIPFSDLSDGEITLTVLYAFLAGLSPSSWILLDEPEAHVGLKEVQDWLQRLVDQLDTDGQFFVISHHPQVVNTLASFDPFLFQRPGSGATRVRRAEFDRMHGIPASEQIIDGMLDHEQ